MGQALWSKRMCGVGLLMAVLLPSCATPKQMYPGDRRTRSECAVIEPWDSTSGSERFWRGFLAGMMAPAPAKPGFSVSITPVIPDSNFVTFIEEVDGRTMGDAGSAEVLPGTHSIKVGLRWKQGSKSRRQGQLSFSAQAGHAYVIKARPSHGDAVSAVFWIEEKESNRVVAGYKPAEKRRTGGR